MTTLSSVIPETWTRWQTSRVIKKLGAGLGKRKKKHKKGIEVKGFLLTWNFQVELMHKKYYPQACEI